MFLINWGEKMSRVNTNVTLDPDFGKIVRQVDNCYWVSVTPPKILPYRFILLMPIIEDDEMFEECLYLSINQLVEDGSKTMVENFDMDTFDKVSKSTYIASFDPNNQDVFYWLSPPNHLKN